LSTRAGGASAAAAGCGAAPADGAAGAPTGGAWPAPAGADVSWAMAGKPAIASSSTMKNTLAIALDILVLP